MLSVWCSVTVFHPDMNSVSKVEVGLLRDAQSFCSAENMKRALVCMLWYYKYCTKDICNKVGGKLKLELSVELLLPSRAFHWVLQQRWRPGWAAADLFLWSLGREQLSGASSGSQRPAVYCPARCAGNGRGGKVTMSLHLLCSNRRCGSSTHTPKSGGEKNLDLGQ